MRRGLLHQRRDKNEKPILAALRACGCEVWQISGNGAPDVLARRGGALVAFEVKSEKGRETPNQGAWPIVRTVAGALHLVGIEGYR